MNVPQLICQKKNGEPLSREQIRFLVSNYVAGKIPDYQISALLMAIWFTGMTAAETTELTIAMAESGDVADLSAIEGVKADKHSTGGVADSTTLIVAPLVAACGCKVAKMSGRGLGHTGGTIDKLESIPGFSVDQSMSSFVQTVSDCGLSVIGQTADLAPADKLLYALRDVTCTVDSIPLIAASIMSKKLATGSDVIVLDVKTGNGAFMQDLPSAVCLAETMVKIGTAAGKKISALVTDMNQPLGSNVGNALEIREIIDVLNGKRSGDLKTVSFAIASQILITSGIASRIEHAHEKLENALTSGRALDCLARMIAAQSGNPGVVDQPELLPSAQLQIAVTAQTGGSIKFIDTARVGHCAAILGAGRKKKQDPIDPAVGICMEKRLGDQVVKGETLAVFHVNDEKHLRESMELFLKSIVIEENYADLPKLIYEVIGFDEKK
ncbi:MAG: thymidine phosphorylase [Desulfobacteraceae bacterium]|nr:thymidine phosphorylase [Desulfobacteraceae bacterium]